MAFEWIDAAGSAYNLFRAFRGRDEPESTKGQRRSAERAEKARREARRFIGFAMDPKSSKFKGLEGLYAQRNRKDLVSAIDQIMRQSARARARGDTGFAVNPERRDESRYRALAQGFQEARERARFEARNTLLGAAGQLSGTAQGVNFPVRAGERRGKENFQNITTALGNVKPLAQYISELFDQPGTTLASSGPGPGAGPPIRSALTGAPGPGAGPPERGRYPYPV